MKKRNSNTAFFLSQWNNGDKKGLEALIEHHISWLRMYIHKRIGPVLRKKAESCDYVQDAMVQFLKYGPKIHITDKDHFRALLGRIIESTLSDKHDWYTARRREIARERPLPSDTVLCLDPPRKQQKTPSISVEGYEREALVRLGMELLDEDYREILILRKWDNLSFSEIGKHFGISGVAARMRHNRAVRKLGSKISALRFGKLDKIVNS